MNKTFKFVCVAFMAVAACACNRKDADTVSFGREMSFSALSESVVKSGEVLGDTLPSNDWKIYATATQYRADGVLVSADYFNGPREFSTTDAPITPASQYTSSPASYWPAGEGWMNFLVYSVPSSKKSVVSAVYPVSNATDKVAFTWDTYTDQVDLLYGCRNDVSYSPSSVETVNFNFKHAQAVLGFSVKTDPTKSVKIDSIVISGLKVRGVFTVDNTRSYLNGSWSELESVSGEDKVHGFPHSITSSVFLPEITSLWHLAL